MKTTSAAERNTETRGSHSRADSLPELVDWLSGVAILLGGLFSLLVGSGLLFVFEEDEIAERIADGTTATIGTTELTEAETLELAYEAIWWTGAGFLGTGFVLVLFAVGFVIVRHRAHARTEDRNANSYGATAVFGGVVGVVLAFIPLSPSIGGAVAGYVERGSSERTVSVGALAGVLTSIPLIALLLAVLIGLAAGLAVIELPGLALLVGITMVFVVALTATIGALLGALGGYLGGILAAR